MDQHMPEHHSNDQTTVIGADTHIKGDMTFGSTAKILGTCEGRISGKGEVQIASGSTCKAEVEAARVTIDGQVEGNITARERVQLNANAKMTGDLVATTLVVEGGAAFVGHVRVGPDAAKGGHAHAHGAHGARAHDAEHHEPKVVAAPAPVEKAAPRR
jgi:cytoskeletal protein CcmA (bactofilin family)